MFGCESRAAASASRSSRSSRRSRRPPARTALKATLRPSWRSLASQTTPKPPFPSSRTSSKRPTTSPPRNPDCHSSDAGTGMAAKSRSSADSSPARTTPSASL